MYGLTAEDIHHISTVFKHHSAIKKAILYGSRATGNYRSNSDIDITLIGEALTLTQLFDIENELDDLLLPYKIDLSIYGHLTNNDLRTHIDREGKVFYEHSIDR